MTLHGRSPPVMLKQHYLDTLHARHHGLPSLSQAGETQSHGGAFAGLPARSAAPMCVGQKQLLFLVHVLVQTLVPSDAFCAHTCLSGASPGLCRGTPHSVLWRAWTYLLTYNLSPARM